MATNRNQPGSTDSLRSEQALLFTLVLLTFVGWAWWPVLQRATTGWLTGPQRGVGPCLLLIGALAVLRARTAGRLISPRIDPRGLRIVVVAVALRFAALGDGFGYLNSIALVASVFGVCVLCFGRENIRRLLAPLLYLSMLVPLPETVAGAVAEPLQEAIVSVGTRLAQTAGVAAVPAGTILVAGDRFIDVAVLCSGLGSMFPFVTLAAGLSILWFRFWWQRVLLIALGLPVAVLMISLQAAVSIAFPDSAAIQGLGSWLALALLMIATGLLYGARLLGAFVTAAPDDVPVRANTQFSKTMTLATTARTEAPS